jgi:hypothetical protein
MTSLKREAPPDKGGASEIYSGLAATEYDSTKHNRETPKFQHHLSLASDPRACRLMQQVYDAGPKAVLEMLDEASDRDDALLLLEKYARVADLLKALGADDMLQPFIPEVPK